MERSLAFYGAMGFAPIFQVERQDPPDRFLAHVTGYDGVHIKIAMLKRGEDAIELLEYVKPDWEAEEDHLNSSETFMSGNVHFCLQGDAQLHAALATPTDYMRGAGIIPDGPQAGARVEYYRGPDGETIELFFPLAVAKA